MGHETVLAIAWATLAKQIMADHPVASYPGILQETYKDASTWADESYTFVPKAYC